MDTVKVVILLFITEVKLEAGPQHSVLSFTSHCFPLTFHLFLLLLYWIFCCVENQLLRSLLKSFSPLIFSASLAEELFSRGFQSLISTLPSRRGRFLVYYRSAVLKVAPRPAIPPPHFRGENSQDPPRPMDSETLVLKLRSLSFNRPSR